MRSAITPLVTLLGLDIGVLLAGNAILTETVFNIPGVGRLVFGAIESADLPVIQGVVLLGAFFIVLFNLIVDIAYAYLDPRVRYRVSAHPARGRGPAGPASRPRTGSSRRSTASRFAVEPGETLGDRRRVGLRARASPP